MGHDTENSELGQTSDKPGSCRMEPRSFTTLGLNYGFTHKKALRESHESSISPSRHDQTHLIAIFLPAASFLFMLIAM